MEVVDLYINMPIESVYKYIHCMCNSIVTSLVELYNCTLPYIAVVNFAVSSVIY